MQKMTVWIYRPDRHPHPNIDIALCYSPKEQSYYEFQRDQEEAYQYKADLIKQKIEAKRRPNKHFVEDYWR